MKGMPKIMTMALALTGMLFFKIGSAQGIPYQKGRIIISSDGNEHDHDDWAATPMSLALLSAKGLQDSLRVYAFSDHIWGSDQEMGEGSEQMRISALEGKKIYGFNSSKFIEAVDQPQAAIQAMVDEINESDSLNVLYIIAAGPMHVVGSALAEANSNKLKFVRLISHSNWNNKHADKPYEWEKHEGWTWSEIISEFGPKGLQTDRILDQNGGKDYLGLKAPKERYDWIKTSGIRKKSKAIEAQLDWLYERQLTCIKKGDFDPSDAGMLVYLLTGKQKTDPEDVKEIIESQALK